MMPSFSVCRPRIWNQGKAQRPHKRAKRAVCRPRIWNQGKAVARSNPREALVCRPRIWNQGKAGGLWAKGSLIVCRPRIWNQGKAPLTATTAASQFAALVFGIKAKPQTGEHARRPEFAALVFGIKAKRRRQARRAAISLPPSYLESRQSMTMPGNSSPPVCRPRIWNQGKAASPSPNSTSAVCRPRIWNQGKAQVSITVDSA